MRASVDFQDERLELEIPDARVVADWHGPTGVEASLAEELISRALENPRDFPPLRKAIVPGDRVVIALGSEVPEVAAVLSALNRTLESCGVEPGSITVLASPGAPADLAGSIPPGIAFQVHDPEDRTQLAYLAATSGERRVYLNRLITDADLVIPVGRLGYDPVLGYRGPWSAIFPDLSDKETRRSYRTVASDPARAGGKQSPLLKESAEVCWLLGCQFQLGLLGGISGLVAAVAGLGEAVMEQGGRAVDNSWCITAESRAELVIVGIGLPGKPAEIGDVARGLAAATDLVQRGGKIVALSRASGELGPAMRRLIAVDDPRAGPDALRGHESDADYTAARQLARALAWADVYLLSALDPDEVESLSMVALDRPEEARRLAAVSSSSVLVSRADLVRAAVADEAD